MSTTYAFAAEFWLAVVGAGLFVPLLVAVARETRKAIDCLRPDPHGLASLPSHPQPSAPSGHGF